LSERLREFGFHPDSSTILSGHDDNKWWPVVNALRERQLPDPPRLDRCLKNLEGETTSEVLLSGVFLSLCLHGYYNQSGIPKLTEAFLKSGKIFDYREHFERNGIKLVRRYPTGGLSEKCALLLPAMIECFGDELRIKSPFFVAKSLGFTGGTWDKLSSLDGFEFPSPGDATLEILSRGNCAITVTLGKAAPADRVFYRRRSETSTIECDPLIVSSIASKHAAVPVHAMVLDVRTGVGAFIPDEAAANRIGDLIRDALRAHRMNVLVSVIGNAEPNGSAIGDYLEVLEAVEILRGQHSGSFDLRGKKTQLAICCDFFVKMIKMARVETDSSRLVATIDEAIASGKLWAAQKRFLVNHGVPIGVIELLEKDPWRPLSSGERKHVLSKYDGYLRDINQRAIGSLVYNGFYEGHHPSHFDGVVLKKRKFDPVAKGDLLCTVYAPHADALDSDCLCDTLFEFG
jgi:pyrimidine-nucleoside phosphorylase